MFHILHLETTIFEHTVKTVEIKCDILYIIHYIWLCLVTFTRREESEDWVSPPPPLPTELHCHLNLKRLEEMRPSLEKINNNHFLYGFTWNVYYSVNNDQRRKKYNIWKLELKTILTSKWLLGLKLLGCIVIKESKHMKRISMSDSLMMVGLERKFLYLYHIIQRYHLYVLYFKILEVC